MAWGAGASVIQNQTSGHGQGVSRPPQGVRLCLQTRVCQGLPWPCLESLQEGSGPPGQSCSDSHTLGSRQTAGGREKGCSPAQHPSPPPRPPLAAPGGQAAAPCPARSCPHQGDCRRDRVPADDGCLSSPTSPQTSEPEVALMAFSQ